MGLLDESTDKLRGEAVVIHSGGEKRETVAEHVEFKAKSHDRDEFA